MMEMETEIGNRGSKSIIGMPIHTFVIIVNEQRVEGSWWEKYKNTWPKIHKCISHLRCTLMGFERNYKVSSFFTEIHTYRGYSTTKKVLLQSFWITGFTDGEGSFHVSIIKNKNYKLGWQVEPCFKLTQHERDKSVLKCIQNYFKVGSIYKHGPQTIQFRVQSIKELDTIINHFKMFPLMTKKCSDLKLFIMVHEIMRRKEHLTQEGLIKIVAIKASMNRGLSEELKLGFPDVVPVVRPLVENPKIIDPNWLAGFTSGEGCFLINIVKSQRYKLGEAVQLVFKITQHEREEQLIRVAGIEFLNCGNIYKNREAFDFIVSKFQDIDEKIIPFFLKYSIQGVKALDFKDFCLVASMMKDKKHLTKDGLDKIKKIKAKMNRQRNY